MIPEHKKRVLITLTEEQHKAIRIAAAVAGKKTSEVVIAALKEVGVINEEN